MQFQHIRPVTLKRAEIKTQSGTVSHSYSQSIIQCKLTWRYLMSDIELVLGLGLGLREC